MDLTKLIKAIAWRAREKGGYVNKTKLVKYLYLFDLAHYRRTGQLLTGFPWRFHLYGPWSEEFEAVYKRLAQQGQINISPSLRPDLDAEFISSPEALEFPEVISDPMLQLEFRRIVDTWANRPLGEMLDHVYFKTEPMEGATRGALLDFGRVDRKLTTQPSQIPEVRPDRKTVERVRRAIEERIRRRGEPTTPKFTPAEYPEQVLQALRLMDEDEGY